MIVCSAPASPVHRWWHQVNFRARLALLRAIDCSGSPRVTLIFATIAALLGGWFGYRYL